MIKVSNVSKFFFKGKPNEIKALQNVNLELDFGLVMLVGKSGCGKTTLLNTIGGLEKPDCGSITIGDTTINRYQCEQWDKLRNRTIGYVFQNYNLIDELTVAQNLELVLKLAGIDPVQYDERIQYALSLVGMEKFAARHPSTLSGGQQQRVGIARAIVKGAKVIIADEPTGNLDDTNTIAVMELLKGLSKHCLVVVVTHEEDLAAFYADRIIRISDGCIVEDSANRGEGTLAHRAADRVFLGDMDRQDFVVDGLDIALFRDGDMPNAKVTVVCQNGRILLKVDGDAKVSYITDNSTIRLEEGKFVARSAADKDIAVDTDILSEGSGKQRRIFTAKECFKNAFMRIYEKRGVRRRNPYRLLYLTSVFFVILMALSGPAFLFNRADNCVVDDNVLAIEGDYSQNTLPSGLPDECLVLNRAVSSIEIACSFGNDGKYISVGGNNTLVLMPYSAVGGTAQAGEVYIDRLLYDRMVKADSLDGVARNTDELVGLRATLATYPSMYYNALDCYINVDGADPYAYDVGSLPTVTLTVKGIVNRNMPVVYLSDADYNALKPVHYAQQTRSGGTKYYTLVYAKNINALKRSLEDAHVVYVDINEAARAQFYRDAVMSKLVWIILAGIVLLIQIFGLYRTAKNDYLGKLKTYAQYRSIGVSRGAIYGKISMESAVTSLFTSLRGWLITSIIMIILSNLKIVHQLTMLGITLLYYPVWFALVCGAFLAVLGQAVNLLSPMVMLTHTPANLMSKYDM